MMEMDGHETKLVTMADRATQTDEPYEPTMEMEHKQKKPRGRKRKSLEDATINMDPSAPRMDGIDFKHIDQLSSPKRKRLREEKIKPIEELKFADIKSYNRNQLRAYCSIYGVKRKRKGEMEYDLAKYAALFHPGENEYDVTKFQPTEYSGIPIARKRSESEGGNSPYSPSGHATDQGLQTMHDGQMMSSSVEPGLTSDQHMAHQIAHQMAHQDHQLHGAEHQMGQIPVSDHAMSEGQITGQISPDHHMPQDHQISHHALNDHQIGADQQLADDQNLQSEQHLVPDGHLTNEQHMAGEQHLTAEQQPLITEQHIGGEHMPTDPQEHQLASQEQQYAETELQQGASGEIGSDQGPVLHYQVQQGGDGGGDGTELEGGMVHPTHDDHPDSGEHHPHPDHTEGTGLDETEVGDDGGVETA